jgi:hypothetical protein
MNKKISVIVFTSMLVVLLTSAAVPLPGMAAVTAEKSDLVNFKVVNKSSGYVYLWLDGPAFYYFAVKPEETGTFTVLRDEYSLDVRYCGARTSSTADLTLHTTMIMPVCGGRATQAAKSPHVVDVTEAIKIVPVSVENEATTRVLAILTGPSTYVFLLDKDESKDYTIAKGEYNVKYYACGKVGARKWFAQKNQRLRLTCPN